jgi:hypothetical protein
MERSLVNQELFLVDQGKEKHETRTKRSVEVYRGKNLHPTDTLAIPHHRYSRETKLFRWNFM